MSDPLATRASSVPSGLVASPAELASVARRPVVVLYGGRSAEREVSLVSGRAVFDALGRVLAETGDVPRPRVTAVEIDARGRWQVGGEPLAPHEALGRLPADALVFFGLHGGEGEDGRLQAFLETAGRPYTGSGPAASTLCMDKRATRALLAEAGLAVAPGRWVSAHAWREARDSRGEASAATWRELGVAHAVAKPNAGGSSVDTYRVSSEAELAAALDAIVAHGDDALVEAWVEGLEATVGIVGNPGGELRTLPVVEIRPKPGRFFDYDEKYGADGAVETCPPRELAPAAVAALEDAALVAYRTLGCAGYARVDFIVPEHGGEPVVLEVNTLPGFTPRSLLPQAAAVLGIDFPRLCLELCALALARTEP